MSMEYSSYAKSTGLKINAAKTKAMRMNTNNNQPLEIDNTKLYEITFYILFGRFISKKQYFMSLSHFLTIFRKNYYFPPKNHHFPIPTTVDEN
jgi:hypothetical protein